MKINKITLFLLFFYCVKAFCLSVDVDVDPANPVAGESFYLIFKIKNANESEPEISFNPDGADVLGRTNQGLSIRTVYINGKLMTTREITYSYELAVNSSKNITINNIKVTSNGEEATHSPITISISKYAKKNENIFAIAIPEKTEVFVNEGILVNYYLYRKINVLGKDIETFPKLEKFLKRYIDIPPEDERVNYNGEVYVRSRMYTAKIFANKAGTATIDSIRFRVQYSDSPDVFNSFGFGLSSRNFKTKSISSPPVKLIVKPLPATNVPPSFTGLVGKHQFKFSINKNKFLINEAIECRLEVTGEGALELLDAPSIFKDASLEEFETKADLQIQKDGSATKTYDYTYLARAASSFKEREIEMSYFNPQLDTYETILVKIPPIEVDGTTNSIPSSNNYNRTNSLEKNKIESPSTKLAQVKDLKILSPIFKFKSIKHNYLLIFNSVLGFGCLFLLLLLFRGFYQMQPHGEELSHLVNEMKKKGITYSNLYSFLIKIGHIANENMKLQSEDEKLAQIVSKLKVSKDTKNYLNSLLIAIERGTFKSHEKLSLSFERKYFDEIINKYEKSNSFFKKK